MVEWLGQMISGWPTWLVAVAVIAFFVVAGIVIFYVTLAWGAVNTGTTMPAIRKRHNRK